MPTRRRWEIHNQKEEAEQLPVRNNIIDLNKDSNSLRGRAKAFKQGNKNFSEGAEGTEANSQQISLTPLNAKNSAAVARKVS